MLGDTYIDIYWWEEFIKYSGEMDWGDDIYTKFHKEYLVI
jgi:hypothetical protein